MLWVNLFLSILSQMGYLLLSPLFWAVVVLIWWQNSRLAKQKSNFFHLPKEKVWRKTLQSVGFGLLGGIIGSMLMLFLGLDIGSIGIEYLWIIALILALINPRFICFAYSGGILIAANALVGFPALNAPQLLALIGVLHFVEGTLVYFAGHLQAMPIYVKWHDGRIIGGFNMQNFWPLPLIALMLQEGGGNNAFMAMPDWWPILSNANLASENIMYLLVAVIAALGYSDLALVHEVRWKAKKSAKYLLIYGAVIILLAVSMEQGHWWNAIIALAAPLGHELIIHLGQRMEKNGEPLYLQPQQGVMVLDVLEGLPAQKMGVKPHDIIIAVNGKEINNYRELLFFSEGYNDLLLKRGNEFRRWKINSHADKWGIIPVPNTGGGRYLYFGGNFHLLKVLRRKIKRIFKR